MLNKKHLTKKDYKDGKYIYEKMFRILCHQEDTN